MLKTVVIAPHLRRQIEDEARKALPGECCGLLQGVRSFDDVIVEVVHPARNLAEANDRFEIDPAEHFRLLRQARVTGQEIVGCYHSHPNGCPAPSDTDGEYALEHDFVWLIAAVTPDACDLAAFTPENGAFRGLRLAKTREN
ncbi:MAG TPA: M67 family metallopeptidase [Rhizomicrobium sp.]|jgi:proteasome lid subunit RPN8/RPN11|nr:M67 family metallopeptidase [Rhizomicrobium sp.]